MKDFSKPFIAAIAASFLYAAPASALVTTAGSGGFDDGYATTITYEADNSIANRGTTLGRDNPLNALGAPDSGTGFGSGGVGGTFFEIGLGSSIELTFGTLFDTSATVFEVTLGDRSNFIETADIAVGFNGIFQNVASIDNSSSSSSVLLSAMGVFDTLKITDTTVTNAAVGGFDIDAVRVTPVPLPAGILLMLTAIGGFGVLRFRSNSSAKA